MQHTVSVLFVLNVGRDIPQYYRHEYENILLILHTQDTYHNKSSYSFSEIATKLCTVLKFTISKQKVKNNTQHPSK